MKSRCSSYKNFEAWHRGPKVMPLFGNSNIHTIESLSQTSSIVFKSSQWNLLHLIPMKSQCLAHLFCEAWHRGSKVMPLFHNYWIPVIDVEGSIYLSPWMIALSFSFDIQTNFSKQLFANYNMLLSCLEMDPISTKTA